MQEQEKKEYTDTKKATWAVYEVLKKYSSWEHSLSQKQVQELVKEMYGLKVSRNTIGDTLNRLREFYGKDVICCNETERFQGNGKEDAYRYGFYFDHEASDGALSDEEITKLLNVCLYARNLNAKEAQELIRKLKGMATEEFQKKIDYIDDVPVKQFNINPRTSDNLQMLRRIISGNRGKKQQWVSFDFNYYSSNSEKKLTFYRSYTVLPLAICEANHKYYLLCVTDGHFGNISHYRIDLLTGIKCIAHEMVAEAEDIFNAYNAWYGSGLKNHVYKAYKEKKSFKVEVTKVENKPYEELQDMIGLTEVKTVIDRIIAASRVLRMRERMGLKTEDASLHMIFSGNPGTAKTTVARLLAKILKDEDAIQSGKFVECGRQDLVGKYVGWTAHIVEEKFKEAMGGVLFIDEAYALVDDSNTFGAEAINTITQMMENYRNDVIVIFAGYPDKMKNFLDQNEGLKSRIAFHLDFPDYWPDELIKILELMAKKKEYTIGDDALEACREIFVESVREKNYGNGRFVRNVLEQAILKQADRLIRCNAGKELSREDICCLKKEDFAVPEKSFGEESKIIGFCA